MIIYILKSSIQVLLLSSVCLSPDFGLVEFHHIINSCMFGSTTVQSVKQMLQADNVFCGSVVC